MIYCWQKSQGRQMFQKIVGPSQMLSKIDPTGRDVAVSMYGCTLLHPSAIYPTRITEFVSMLN